MGEAPPENGDEREEAIRALFPFVKKIARRIVRLVAGSDAGDLIGDGCVGLIRAVDSFDPARGITLDRYAARVVAGAMLNGVRRLDPVSERVRRDIREAERERYALASERGALPSMKEMEERRPGLRRARIAAHRHAPLSLDGPLRANEEAAPALGSDPAQIVADARERALVRNALVALPERQRRLMELHYFAELSLHQIGREMNVSPQRASQLHLSALAKLRKLLPAP